MIFICDSKGNLFSAYSTESKLLKDYKMPKIIELNMPWVAMSFNIYHKNRKPTFIFKYNNKKFIAAYEEIPDIKSDHPWNIAIVTPIQDIIAPLQKTITISFIFVFIALLIGIILSTIFASRISKPIIKLTKDAELICQLKLEEVKQTKNNHDVEI